MATVIVSFETQGQSFPGKFNLGGFKVSIGTAEQTVAASPATFLDVAPGDYAGFVVALKEDGSTVGDPFPFAFTVPQDVTLVQVPLSAVVSLVEA